MRSIRLFAPGDMRCTEIEAPRIEKPDDVLLKVRYCGVCGSDIPRVMVKGAHTHPITLGHEFSGEVLELGGAVKELNVGDRVTVMPLIPCGQCSYCKIGDYHLCDDYAYYGSRIDGAMADFIRVKADNVLKLPDNVGYEAGAMTDPASIALHAMRSYTFYQGQTAIVFGLGAIGLFAIQWLKILGCRDVFAVDIFDSKLELARQLGATFTFNGLKQDVVKEVKANTGEGIDFVVELAGSKKTQLQALQVAGKKSHIVFCGISYDVLVIPSEDLNKILRSELSIPGYWISSIAPLPINEWKTSLDYMSSGKLKTDPLITHRFKLEQCKECFDMLYKRKEPFIKVLFDIQAG